VLIAEDNKVNQHVAQLIVAHAGHRVDLADNGLQAVDAARVKQYDVILMDLQMPELDGFAATKQIRALPGRAGTVPIMALTSHAMAGVREEVLAAGMDDYVSKPFDAAVLLAKLQHLVAFREAGEARGPVANVEHPRRDQGEGSFDRAKLDQLSAAAKPAAFASLLAALIASVEQRVATLKGLTANGGFAAAGREAHDLVAIAGNVGAMRLSALARHLQHACKAGDPNTCREIAASLHAEAEAVLPQVRAYQAARAA
jgi:CheY-like chemotaxis protein/HPt (histidine-containing phosphotransfer) domain-containing protein